VRIVTPRPNQQYIDAGAFLAPPAGRLALGHLALCRFSIGAPLRSSCSATSVNSSFVILSLRASCTLTEALSALLAWKTTESVEGAQKVQTLAANYSAKNPRYVV